MEFGNIADNFVGLCFVKIKSMKITKDGFDIEYTGFAYNSLIMDFVKRIKAQGGLSVAGGCRCLTKDGNTSIEKEGYIPYPLQA